MKKSMFLMLLGILFLNSVYAQTAVRKFVGPTMNPKTSKKAPKQNATSTRSAGEVYVGYSGSAAPTNGGAGFRDERKIHNGVGASVTVNVSRFAGIKTDFSSSYRNEKQVVTINGVPTTLTRRTGVTNILGGVQIKDNESEAIIQPFAHLLVGAGNYRQRFQERDCDDRSTAPCSNLVRGWGVAGAVGGGFDLKVANRAGIRFVGDYNPMRIKDETINNFRFGVGIVFK
jgi:hypothetical protein